MINFADLDAYEVLWLAKAKWDRDVYTYTLSRAQRSLRDKGLIYTEIRRGEGIYLYLTTLGEAVLEPISLVEIINVLCKHNLRFNAAHFVSFLSLSELCMFLTYNPPVGKRAVLRLDELVG